MTPGILIIEDDPAIRESLAEILVDEGYEVATAAGGFEALAYLQHRPLPRLILLDLMMGLMSGWEFRQRQRQDPRLAQIPTVVISAVSDLATHAQRLGTSSFLPKPVNIPALIEIVRRYAGAE